MLTALGLLVFVVSATTLFVLVVKVQSSTGQMIFNGKGKGKSIASAVVHLHYWLHPPLHAVGQNFWHPCPLNKISNQIIQSSLPHLSLLQPLYINVSFHQNGLLNLMLRWKGEQFFYACPSSVVPTNQPAEWCTTVVTSIGYYWLAHNFQTVPDNSCCSHNLYLLIVHVDCNRMKYLL